MKRSTSEGPLLAASDSRLSRSPLSSVVTAQELAFVSGVVGRSLDDGHIPPDFESQYHIAMANLERALDLAGCTLDSVAKTNVYLVERSHFGRMNALYAGYFRDPKPARSTLIVAGLSDPALLFEIDAVAVCGSAARTQDMTRSQP